MTATERDTSGAAGAANEIAVRAARIEWSFRVSDCAFWNERDVEVSALPSEQYGHCCFPSGVNGPSTVESSEYAV